MKYLLILALLFCLSCSSQTKTYLVKKTDNAIIVTGNGSDKAWEDANILTAFLYPWQPKNLPATAFKALWSDTHLYFLYNVEDSEIITPERGLGELDAVQSDRVEIFFKAADETKPYFSLEMDALGRCLDSDAQFFKNNIDIDWSWPKDDFVLKASQNEEGYTVEGSISLASLRKLGIYQDDEILNAGLYRGEYYSKEDGKTGIKWISWVIANPDKPNFHVPNSFGILRLEN
ncbi:hypothetical protein FF125_01700 [Aureibaculum algae]|uniref:Carbohydrate-binding domain-containing protein n=1 Tax=Aureibaculum algae TaxID=2584122 RepID=A0A5B7TLL2_9FLAO|nr:carbohydrate-binding family 9-like protein [Aureibaculum algae]QCX37215.1 hypothetical protein FF125_01700 [Aureibaculum algae]